MTATVTAVACRCAHTKAAHEQDGFAPQCTAASCTCLRFRPGDGAGAALSSQAVAQVRALSRIPPAAPPAAPVRAPLREPDDNQAPAVRPPTIEQILQAGKRSGFKRTVALTERIAVEIDDLRARLSDERAAAEQKRVDDAEHEQARREIAELEAKLRAAKAKLRGDQPRPEQPRTATHWARAAEHVSCPDCGRTLHPMGLGRHRLTHVRKAGASG